MGKLSDEYETACIADLAEARMQVVIAETLIFLLSGNGDKAERERFLSWWTEFRDTLLKGLKIVQQMNDALEAGDLDRAEQLVQQLNSCSSSRKSR